MRTQTAMAASPVIQPGFADPVHDAQACFRAILGAMALPCKPVSIPATPSAENLAPAIAGPLLAGFVSVALALCDAETPVWLDESLDTPAMRRHLRFHCGCPLAMEPEKAAFAFIGNAQTMPRLGRFNAGTAEYPDRSATLVIGVRWDEPGVPCTAFGPGISPGQHPMGLRFSPAGLPGRFWNDWADCHAAYPLGVDAIFMGPNPARENETLIACFPRTVSIIVPDVEPNAEPNAEADGGKEKNTCMSR